MLRVIEKLRGSLERIRRHNTTTASQQKILHTWQSSRLTTSPAAEMEARGLGGIEEDAMMASSSFVGDGTGGLLSHTDT